MLIADDGSGPQTRDAVQEMQKKMQGILPIRHIWQEDIGFRKPKILNETVRQSSGEYLIFIDGDCMAHKHFVRSHLESSSNDAVLGGKRVEIGKELSEWLLKKQRLILN